MALTIEVNGNIYKDAVQIKVGRSMHNFCGYFDAVASANTLERLPVKRGDAVRIFADGNVILTGYIERVSAMYDSSFHEISFSGRDITADAFDSTVSGNKVFTTPNSLDAIIRQVLDAGNMQSIGVFNTKGTPYNLKSTDKIEADVGQTIFNFLEPYARKVQAVMTTNENGDIMLARAGTVSSGMRLVNGENILSASFESKDDDLFNKYIARSQLDPIGFENEEPSNIVSQSGETAIDNNVRASRVLEFDTEEETDNSQSFNRAQFEANIRRANSVNYKCKVQGHSHNNAPFRINTTAFVDDYFCDISSNMLIHSIEFDYSLNGGSTTTLQMTYKDAYTLKAQQDARDAARQKVGSDF